MRLGIIMNGVTGRMGTNQHLLRSILAIREQGGVPIGDGEVIWPEPVLVGRSGHKLRALADAHGLEHWTTDLEACLPSPECQIYFDAQVTPERAPTLKAAIAVGKHVYCEKPIARTCPPPSSWRGLRVTRRSRTASSRTSCSCQEC
jgi:predicted dehydrogenase